MCDRVKATDAAVAAVEALTREHVRAMVFQSGAISDRYERWNRPTFLLDVAPHPPERFLLPAPGGTHFVSRTDG